MIGWLDVPFQEAVLKAVRAELERIEPHEHYEGMNECSVCDENIGDAILRCLRKAPGVDKPEKMDEYFSVFNLHCNDAGKRANAAFRKKYGAALFNREIAPKHRAGIMSIFNHEMTKHQRVWVRLVRKYVNEGRV